MATWSEIQTHLRSTYRLSADEPHAAAMAWAYGDGRTQRIVARRFVHDDVEMVELKSPFARVGGPDALELLRENCRLPVGAVALSGEVFLLVHNAALAGLDTAGFDALLAQIAALADRLERKHGGGDQF